MISGPIVIIIKGVFFSSHSLTTPTAAIVLMLSWTCHLSCRGIQLMHCQSLD